MPPVRSTTGDNILEYTVVAANALRDVATAAQIPFVGTVCTITLIIIPMVQNTKFQKDRCFRIVEDIHRLLWALMNLSMHSEEIQSPNMLNEIAKYALILQKIDSCLRAQQDLGTIKRLFKQSELVTQLENCETELKGALDNFTIEQGVGISSAIVEFKIDTEGRHQQLLELISTQSDSIDTLSSIGRSSFNSSSGSFSLLPASPQIFHGRESELQEIVNTLLAEPARVAILGPGGMGKTSLAVAALHSPKVLDKYPTRHFIPCDSAQTNGVLFATIASHLGLDASRGSARHIAHHLTMQPPCLLVLDNFETPWEPVDGRAKVEELLALLADVSHVGLLITMRGAERPSKVQWTRPFLPPLRPLSPTAAHQTFIEIADEIHDVLEVDQLLEITDNIPLAVQLVANVAASEGCQATLERWKIESTSLFSAGYDKQSNLEISIKLSLTSPRIASLPHAVDLLSLMSLLSDGISDADLVQSKPPIPEILKCKATLVRTSLAYVDHAGRLKVLAPIRDYIRISRPPSPQLVQPLRKHLNSLLKLWRTPMSRVGNLAPHLLSNLGNMHNVLVYGLDCDQTDIEITIQAITILNQLNIQMHRGLTPLMSRLQEMLPQINDHQLCGQFIIETFRAKWFLAIPNPDKYMEEGIEHFHSVNNIEGEAELYLMVAEYYADSVHDYNKAKKTLSLCAHFSIAMQLCLGPG
ncbi:P-loop containing nucleoside triphosphate hydrolase protein [Mycena olivaceomarginata]|nr:P-loop containing nucleoside triphosphate hydrolase protein [Mycena olivaceomarginata]